MARFRCQGCRKVFSIPITLELLAIAEDPHVVLCAECELYRERARATTAIATREDGSNG